MKYLKKIKIKLKLYRLHKIMAYEGYNVRLSLKNKDFEEAKIWNEKKKCSAKAIRTLLKKYYE